MGKGLSVKSVSNIDENKKVVSTLTKIYSENDIDEYRNEFINQVNIHKIGEDVKFDDDSWYMIDRIEEDYKTHRGTNIKYKIEDSKIKNSLKCFVIILLKYYKVTGDYCRRAVKIILEAIEISNYFHVDNYYDFEFWINLPNSHNFKEFAVNIKRYLEFCGLEVPNEYEELLLLDGFIKRDQESRVRKLPDFRSMILFNYIINDFFKECSQAEREKYLIIKIWWDMTTIIPIRTTEFLILKKDSIYHNKEENKYYAKVGRIKNVDNKSKNNNIDILKEIEISKELYGDFIEYKKYCDFDEDRTYIWSYFLYANNATNTVHIGRKIHTDFITPTIIYSILDEFYSEVINKKYGYNIVLKKEYVEGVALNSNEVVRINIGDTRHFAFCSLMLQGLDPLTIAKIGGHHKVSSQLHYQKHLDVFINSNILELASINLKSKLIDKNDDFIEYDGRRELIKPKEKNNNIYLKKERGYCIDKDFPSNCSSNCRKCDFFVDDDSSGYLERKVILNEERLKCNSNISRELESWREVSKLIVKERQYIEKTQNENLKTIAKRLRCQMNEAIEANLNCWENDILNE